ncbi:hypothetical protein [Halalkalicoccus sp. NIPERK01]|uniref:hypothetical protein n=1 Tax=Halalkalicoccus sp. NIPERK01 TaxID=3053469 RepID=UPI00256F4B04|nr:hypothetical protein [Halalkalicoccus sp. NIPERK01]MDL5362089.1 hypothetical protein [Halalkalicoccus sp. NIPERK01]
MIEISNLVKYSISTMLFVIIGGAIGNTISGIFGFPYWPTVSISVAIRFGLGMKLVTDRDVDNSTISKENVSTENESDEENIEWEDNNKYIDIDSQSDSAISEMNKRQNSKYSIGKSNEEILKEQVGRINDYVSVLENNIIRILDEPGPDPYRTMLLYVIGARYSFAEGYRESPIVYSNELKSHFRYNNTDIDVFIRRVPSTFYTYNGPFPSYSELDDFSFTVGVSDLETAINWALDDDLPVGLDVRLDFGYARMALQNAREKCEEIEKREAEEYFSTKSNSSRSNTYGGVEYEIKESIHDIRDYPIFNEDDVVWRDFMRTADTALRNVQKESVGGILHCIDRMKVK